MPRQQKRSGFLQVKAAQVLADSLCVTNSTSLNGPISNAYTVDAAGGAQTITAAELISGYMYNGAAGADVALTLPGADAVQTALLADGIVTAAGYKLPSISINVTDAFNLTVTAGTGETVIGPSINNNTAKVEYIFTAAATATATVILSKTLPTERAYTIDTATTPAPTATEVIDGFFSAATYDAANCVLPAATDIQTELLTRGITSAAGMKFPVLVFDNAGGANTLTVTAADGTITILGNPAIAANLSAVVHYIMTGAATASAVVVVTG